MRQEVSASARQSRHFCRNMLQHELSPSHNHNYNEWLRSQKTYWWQKTVRLARSIYGLLCCCDKIPDILILNGNGT